MQKLSALAKSLRNRPTEAEKLLWRHLKSKQTEGLTKEFISKTTQIVIPACRESFFKKDCGQAAMTKKKWLCGLTYGLISKFRRQQPIDNYIVDFICLENRIVIVIEVDGSQHGIEKDFEIEKDSYLNKHGFKILRFWNNEVLHNIEGVLEVIRENCLSHPPLSPPVKRGDLCT